MVPLCKDIPYGLDAQSKFLARNLQFLEALRTDKKRPGMIQWASRCLARPI